MDLKKEITEMIYKNSHDTSEGVLIDFKVITPLIENIVAIAVTHCCTELKGKETLSFEDWVKHNYREGKHKYYSLNGLNCLSYEEVLQKYNTYKQSL